MKNTSNEDYNGWKNRETWNIPLHLNNDEALYNQMEIPFKSVAELKRFCFMVFGETTPDNIRIDSPKIDWKEIMEALND